MATRRPARGFSAAILACALVAAGTLVAPPASGAWPAPDVVSIPSPRAAEAIPHVEHYFVLILENENADDTFGAASAAPYLARTLASRGAFVPNYFGTGHLSLDNYVSMVSGQGPNPATQTDCQIFSDLTPGTAAANGQALGSGCVYPASVKTIADQLDEKGMSWKGYMEDMAAGGSDPAPSCRHPAIGSMDTTQSAEAGDQYATRHNPFVYFHSIIDSPSCAKDDVDLNQLPGDLKSAETTPTYSFITPNLCHDGHDAPCVDGQPGGLASANTFLQEWVPKILASPAYRDHGMLLITFDEAEATGGGGDASSCCGEIQGPNTLNNGFLINGSGGGRVGAVALSPCTRPGTVTQTPYNHYSQLSSVEQNFGLSTLGYAGTAGLKTFGSDILNLPNCGQAAKVGSVRPAVARRGKRTKFTVKVRSEFPDCRAGVTIKLGRVKAKTNGAGKATLIRTYGSVGKKPVVASKPGCASGRKKLRVKR